jgi:ATP-dependent DNA helicase RecG
VLYADLDLSTLRTPPAGRLAVRTAIRHPDDLDRLWQFVRSEAQAGRASFVVVPAIEDADDSDVVAAESEAKRLTEVLAPLRVGLVHGRMKAADRDAELGRLRDGALDVLVGTTVLEVGVDVPRASVMVIHSADRFGLAQLHQLRGRVGRGDDQSYAALVSTAASTREWAALVEDRSAPTTTEQARLVAVARTTDGFELAERDWELRREGDVLGLVQSGLPRLRVASLQNREHQGLARRARERAETLLDGHGELGPATESLRRELDRGWLARVYRAEPANAT